MAIVIETATETLVTMPIEEFPTWLKRHGLIVVDVVPRTWPPKLICRPRELFQKSDLGGEPKG